MADSDQHPTAENVDGFNIRLKMMMHEGLPWVAVCVTVDHKANLVLITLMRDDRTGFLISRTIDQWNALPHVRFDAAGLAEKPKPRWPRDQNAPAAAEFHPRPEDS